MSDFYADRDARNPIDVPESELNEEIKVAFRLMSDHAFKSGGPVISSVSEVRSVRLMLLMGLQSGYVAEKNIRISEANVDLQKGVICLTKWLLVLTVVLTFVAAAQVYLAFAQLQVAREANRLNENANANPQEAAQKQPLDKNWPTPIPAPKR